ncbi:MAG TPA: hypothetical protein VN937_28420 [Blastocatellia bacterium]|nr:hypothetical protein [Blastocatellia bacterium]
MDQQDVQKALQIAGAVATQAGQFGVPVAGLVGTILTGVDGLVASIGARSGKTREQILADTQVEDAANLVELLKDQAAGE